MSKKQVHAPWEQYVHRVSEQKTGSCSIGAICQQILLQLQNFKNENGYSMAKTYTQLYIHIVFSVKHRQNLIHKSWKEELYKYITGIVKGKSQKLYSIGGVENHIHILVSIKPGISISDLVKYIKHGSNLWIQEKRFMRGKFEWQEGFGAFTVSSSQLKKTITYINNQEQHHRRVSFEEEYVEFMRKYEIEYEDKYLF